MNTPLRIMMTLAAVLAGGWLAYSAADKWYLTPRSALLATIDGANVTLARHRESQQKHRDVARQTQAIVDRTLGANLETVDHRLRSRLSRLAEQAKLQGVSVGTSGSGKPLGTPAGIVFRGSAYRDLRVETDFVEVEASISGLGALEDVVRMITEIESEPWIKRIDEVRLDPRDNGARVSMKLRLTTLFIPGRAPAAEQPVQPPNAELQSRFAALVSGNPFRVPPRAGPAKPKPADAPPPAQPAPPPFPFAEWALTGVAQGPRGPEAWLRHQPTGETRVLTPGQGLSDAIFNAASDEADAAEFVLGDQRFFVTVGATMDQRTPAGQ